MRHFLPALLFLAGTTPGWADFREFREVPGDPVLEAALKATAETTLKEFPRLTADNLALSVVDLSNPESARRADYHGDLPFYPASLMKLFLMVEVFHQNRFSPEIDRALRELIRVSDNDAASYLLDVVTGTTSGPELEGEALSDFIDRRRTVNRYFALLGYDVSVMIKPFSFGPYGRDVQALGEKLANRNRASANSFASLLLWIVRRHSVSPKASEAMLVLLERPLSPPRPEENQVREFFGEALPEGSRLWSKEGDTSEVRHDAAYVELPDSRKFVIVILTRGAADEKTLLPTIGRLLLANLGRAVGHSH